MKPALRSVAVHLALAVAAIGLAWAAVHGAGLLWGMLP